MTSPPPPYVPPKEWTGFSSQKTIKSNISIPVSPSDWNASFSKLDRAIYLLLHKSYPGGLSMEMILYKLGKIQQHRLIPYTLENIWDSLTSQTMQNYVCQAGKYWVCMCSRVDQSIKYTF